MTVQNTFNYTIYGFAKGSIPVTDASGNILQQKAPADGSVLVADSSQTTGYRSLVPAAAPTITFYGTQSNQVATNSALNGVIQLNVLGDPGINTFATSTNLYIMNTAPALMGDTVFYSTQVTNGYSYCCNNQSSNRAIYTLQYVPWSNTSSNAQTGPVSQEVQFINTNTGPQAIQPTNYPIQYGTQVIPVNGLISFNNVGDSITMRMDFNQDKWFVTASIGTLTISSS